MGRLLAMCLCAFLLWQYHARVTASIVPLFVTNMALEQDLEVWYSWWGTDKGLLPAIHLFLSQKLSMVRKPNQTLEAISFFRIKREIKVS